MATTTTALRRQIGSAGDLKSVVRTSVAALADFARAVERGLGVRLRSRSEWVTRGRALGALR